MRNGDQAIVMAHNKRSGAKRFRIYELAMLLLLILSFHCTTFNGLAVTRYLRFGLSITAGACFALSIRLKKLRLDTITALWVLTFLLSLIRNGNIENGNYVSILAFLASILGLVCLQNRLGWYETFLRYLLVLALGHVIVAWILWAFPSTHESLIGLFAEDMHRRIKAHINARVLLGLVPHYTTSGSYIAMGTIAVFSKWLTERAPRKKLRWMCLLLFMLVSLVMTQKRAHFLFSCCTLFILLNLWNRLSARRIFFIILAIVTGGVLIYVLIQTLPGFTALYERFIAMADEDDITFGRVPLYTLALQLFAKNPLWGIGWQRFSNYSSTGLSTHNIYLQLLCETGIIGALIVIPSFVMALSRAFQNALWCRQQPGLHQGIKAAAVFALGEQLFFLMYGITGSPLYDIQTFVCYLMAVAITVSLSGWRRNTARQLAQEHIS